MRATVASPQIGTSSASAIAPPKAAARDAPSRTSARLVSPAAPAAQSALKRLMRQATVPNGTTVANVFASRSQSG